MIPYENVSLHIKCVSVHTHVCVTNENMWNKNHVLLLCKLFDILRNLPCCVKADKMTFYGHACMIKYVAAIYNTFPFLSPFSKLGLGFSKHFKIFCVRCCNCIVQA